MRSFCPRNRCLQHILLKYLIGCVLFVGIQAVSSARVLADEANLLTIFHGGQNKALHNSEETKPGAFTVGSPTGAEFPDAQYDFQPMKLQVTVPSDLPGCGSQVFPVQLELTGENRDVVIVEEGGTTPLDLERYECMSTMVLLVQPTAPSRAVGDIEFTAHSETCLALDNDVVNATAVSIEWIDDTPDYARDPSEYQDGTYTDNGDSDNFFLRHLVRPRQDDGTPDYAFPGKPDYVDLDLWYRILPQDVVEQNLVKDVTLTIYREDTPEEIHTIAVNQTESLEELNEEPVFHVVWPGEEIRNPVTGEFTVAGFYRVQLEARLDTGSESGEPLMMSTSIEDGDAALPGWQCPQDGLAIHDLAFKHRPDVYVGMDERVIPNGPVHPFAMIEKNYRLAVKGSIGPKPAWKKEDDSDENYYEFGSFPEVAEPVWDSSYDVLQASVTHAPVDKHFLDIFGPDHIEVLTQNSFDTLWSPDIPEAFVACLEQELKDQEISSFDYRVQETFKDCGLEDPGGEALYFYKGVVKRAAEKRDSGDNGEVFVLTQQSFETLRSPQIPGDLLACVEEGLKDREIDPGWDATGMIYTVRDHLENMCGLDDDDDVLADYASTIWKAAEERIYHNADRRYDVGKPYLLHRGHVYDGTEKTHPNHIFIHYWMYSMASYAPSNSSGIGSGVLWHEADWEMVQLALRVSNPEFPATKSEWLLPYAATASQHFHGQTLPWRIDRSGSPEPENYDQDYVATTEDGQRIKIYVAENSHATYFRQGVIMSPTESAVGTQYQYLRQEETPGLTIAWDFISAPKQIIEYKLLSLDNHAGKGFYDWSGKWGGELDLVGGVVGPNLESPKFRNVNDKTHTEEQFSIDDDPVRFHERCRKIINTAPDERTMLLP